MQIPCVVNMKWSVYICRTCNILFTGIRSNRMNFKYREKYYKTACINVSNLPKACNVSFHFFKLKYMYKKQILILRYTDETGNNIFKFVNLL